MEKRGGRVIRMSFDTKPEELISEVDRVIVRDITVGGGHHLLRCTHYTDGGSDIYMFVNEST